MSCLGCNKRTAIPNCHSTCADYINYKESMERDKQRILKERIKNTTRFSSIYYMETFGKLRSMNKEFYRKKNK